MSSIPRETMQEDMRHYKARLETALRHESRRARDAMHPLMMLPMLYADVCGWLYADMQGDVAKASTAEWWAIVERYDELYWQWFDEHTGRWTKPRPELDGLSLDQFGEVMESLKAG